MKLVDDFSRYYYDHSRHHAFWMGNKVLKCPLDLWIYQEIIAETKPDVIIESGTLFGGATLFLAMVCDMLGHGEIISIDITRKKTPKHSRITYLLGSSISDEIVENISRRVSGKSVMVILDSDHRKDHVLKELEIYSKFVSDRGYIIVEDTNLNGHPVCPDFGDGPMEAVEEFLKTSSDFYIDKDREKFHMTFNPHGYLRRKRMKVSIVIAILNSHKVVVRQIRHFKNMNLPDDVEIIFVDDGSNPPLYYQDCGLRNFKILFTNDKRPWTQGLARNMGAKEARGEYLFFTDIDHIITREAIEDVRNFNGDKMSFHRYFGILDKRGNIISDMKSMLDFGLDPARVHGRRGVSENGEILAGTHSNTYAIRKSIFEKIGGYYPRYCQNLFHVGGHYQSEESKFNSMFNRMCYAREAKGAEVGSKIYHYPVSKFRKDGNNNPFGLFHKLSLEQVPQPNKE